MSRNYIYSVLSEFDEFRDSFSCVFHGLRKESEIKIDTGAAYSLVPLKTLGVLRSKREEQRQYYIEHNLIGGVIHGVEGVFQELTRQEISSMSKDERLAQRCFTFWDTFHGIQVGGYDLGDRLLHTTCDTQGNILLGMDVLKDFDTHMGLSRKLGRVVFLGCRRDDISKEYLDALAEHFGYVLG